MGGECEIGIIGQVKCEYIIDAGHCTNEPKCFMKGDECKTIGGNSEVAGEMEAPEEPEMPEGPFLQKTYQHKSSSDNSKYYYAAAGFLASASLSGALFYAFRKRSELSTPIADMYT